MKFKTTELLDDFDHCEYLKTFMADLQFAIDEQDWDVAIDFAQNLLATVIVLKEEEAATSQRYHPPSEYRSRTQLFGQA